MGNRRRILIVTHASGLDRLSGGAAYTCSFINCLTASPADVGLLILRPNQPDPAVVRVPWKLKRLRAKKALIAGRWILRGSPWDWIHALCLRLSKKNAARFYKSVETLRPGTLFSERSAWGIPLNDAERCLIEREEAAFQPDYILFNHYFIADYRPQAAIVGILTHELFFDRKLALESRKQILELPAYDQETEKRILAQADHLIAINERDRDILSKTFPQKRIDVALPPAQSTPIPVPTDVQWHVLFIGGEARHNIDAVAWLLDEIWPELHRRWPLAQLKICGAICKHLPKHLPDGITVLGMPPNLRDAYAACSISIVPLRIGSGLKTRIIESLSYGRPVVTTPVGLQGLEVVRDAALCGQSACELADLIADLFNDLPRLNRMRVAASHIIQTHFSEANILSSLLDSPLFVTPPTQH